MKQKFQPLFSPYTLNNGVEIKNRFVVAPLTHWASNPDGSLSEDEKKFIGNRAEGFGLFICAATLVAPSGKTFAGQPEAVAEKDLASLIDLAKLVQKQGAKAILQIHHGGYQAMKELLNGLDIVAPSDDENSGARDLTEGEILDLITAYANATDLAIRAGFDGVEIHGANNYLIQQFFSAQSNRRTDHWGGSLEKRMNFPLAVIDAVIAAKEKHQAKDFIIGYRFSPEEPGHDGLTMADTFALVDALKQKPLQYLHISLWDFYKKARRGADTEMARMQLIHERIGGKLPLIGLGNLFTADQILAAYQTGWAEFIGLGKTVMINPNIVKLIASGKEDEIETQLDLTRPDHYGIPPMLWEMCHQNMAFLPPAKGKNWTPVDI